ncbi:TonB-dependent receptor domain-containing protein [uncultured Sphingomonas sp.]|uniref:TonB-dependent receptor domain-containing protein n=1 Tax=uncultured Sphingomonas sp. TaxID=158754 RepID=UPI003747F963
MLRSMLLAGSALAVAAATPAFAADAPAPAAPAGAPAAETQGNEVVVLGFGQARQVQTITAADIERLTPGTTPLKALSKLPGVNFQSADAFGAYEWSSRISLRGFNQNQLGFTLDGIPLGDMSYGNSNGLHISRAIISENVGSTTVAQGAGALGEASTSNLGGTLQFTSRRPSEEFGIAASGTYGSNDTYRGFVRVDTGDITGGGLKGYLSYGYLEAGKWKGHGVQRQHQANAKLVQDFGARGSITGFFNFSDRRENDYQDLSLDMIRRLGYNADNLNPDYATALRMAQVYWNQTTRAGSATATLPYPNAGLTYPSPYTSVDDAYYDAAGLRRDYLTGITLAAPVNDALSISMTGYYHGNEGQGVWVTPYVRTPGGAPLTIRTTEYGIDRFGSIARVMLETGANHLELGGWFEANGFRQARRFYGLADQATPSRKILQFQRNPLATQFNVDFQTNTTMYYVSDRLTLGQLTLTGGWKGYQVTNKATPIVGTLAGGTIDARDWFLPQVGAVYGFGGAEAFVTYTENMRAFSSSATGTSPFATTQAGFDGIRSRLRPEKSKTAEAGVRYRSGGFQGSIAGYYVDFANRLLAYTNGSGIQGNPVTLQNVGGVENYGAEATALYKITPPLSVFASYSYNHSEYKDNVLGANGALITATRGRTVVDSPRHMVKGEIVYDDSRFLARVGADYMSRRYFTYTNDQSVPGRVLVDATIGYTIGDIGGLHGVRIEGSATNLLDKRYVATIGSNGYTASGDNQTLLAGAPRQFFVSLRTGL